MVAKFIPGFSTIAPPLAGIVRMPLGRFRGLQRARRPFFWAGAFIALGWIFARQLEIVADYAVRLGSWTLVLIGAALGGYITWKFTLAPTLLAAHPDRADLAARSSRPSSTAASKS